MHDDTTPDTLAKTNANDITLDEVELDGVSGGHSTIADDESPKENKHFVQ